MAAKAKYLFVYRERPDGWLDVWLVRRTGVAIDSGLLYGRVTRERLAELVEATGVLSLLEGDSDEGGS